MQSNESSPKCFHLFDGHRIFCPEEVFHKYQKANGIECLESGMNERLPHQFTFCSVIVGYIGEMDPTLSPKPGLRFTRWTHIWCTVVCVEFCLTWSDGIGQHLIGRTVPMFHTGVGTLCYRFYALKAFKEWSLVQFWNLCPDSQSQMYWKTVAKNCTELQKVEKPTNGFIKFVQILIEVSSSKFPVGSDGSSRDSVLGVTEVVCFRNPFTTYEA